MRKHVGSLSVFFMFLLVVAAVVRADYSRTQPVATVAQRSGYAPMGVTAVYRSSIAVVDTADSTHADITGISKIYCGGFTSISVSGRHSVASATVVVQCLRYNTAGTLINMDEATLTGDAARTDGTNYLSQTCAAFDTQGCAYVRILCEAPSSGNVSLWAEAY